MLSCSEQVGDAFFTLLKDKDASGVMLRVEHSPPRIEEVALEVKVLRTL